MEANQTKDVSPDKEVTLVVKVAEVQVIVDSLIAQPYYLVENLLPEIKRQVLAELGGEDEGGAGAEEDPPKTD